MRPAPEMDPKSSPLVDHSSSGFDGDEEAHYTTMPSNRSTKNGDSCYERRRVEAVPSTRIDACDPSTVDQAPSASVPDGKSSVVAVST